MRYRFKDTGEKKKTSNIDRWKRLKCITEESINREYERYEECFRFTSFCISTPPEPHYDKHSSYERAPVMTASTISTYLDAYNLINMLMQR